MNSDSMDQNQNLSTDVSMAEEKEETEKKKSKTKKKVYLPGQALANEEELIPDESTYIIYHAAQTGSPCLSFDIISDNLGNNRKEFPLTLYLVAGTQSSKAYSNQLLVMKMSNLHDTQKESKSDSESDDDDDDFLHDEDDLDRKPELDIAATKHDGGINRIRCTKLGDIPVAATWSERKSVHIWSLEEQLIAVNDSYLLTEFIKNRSKSIVPPLFTFAGHGDEGFALDWSSTTPGNLLSGDCKNDIYLWKPQSGGTWHVDHNPFVGHTGSVEDIQWSPNEASVFASCSVDKTVRIWDIRAKPSKACMLTKVVHDTDVNVLNWNQIDPFIVTGDDDGILKVWDLRQFEKNDAVAKFKHHSAPITSVEWHNTDSSVFAASGADDQITQWDLAVELDNLVDGNVPEVPPQLLFIHQGQKDIKEIHWHAQIPGLLISTAIDGFNIFKTISV